MKWNLGVNAGSRTSDDSYACIPQDIIFGNTAEELYM